MSFYKKILLLFFFATVGSSCSKPINTTAELIAIDSLLDTQIERLSKQKPGLTKEVGVDKTVESSVLEMKNSASWARELDVFRKINLVNSPVYVGKYKVEDHQPDINSNLAILSLSTDQQLPIRSLKLFFQGSHDKVRKLEATYFESNSIFSSTRNLTMEFQYFQGELMLSRYRIEGGQKMIFGDSVVYVVEGIIDYD